MHYWPVFFGSSAFVFISFGLPVYSRSLGASAVEIGGMYSVFTLTLVVVRPIIGVALDRYGRRWFFSAAFGFYALAMWVFAGAAQTLSDFYLARFAQGLGAACMWVSARTIIADVTAQTAVGAAMGRLTMMSVRGSMVGALYGFTLLGMLPIALAWRYAFLGYAAAALVGLSITFWKVKETQPRRAQGSAKASLTELTAAQTHQAHRLFGIIFLSAFGAALIEPIYLIYLQDRFDAALLTLAAAFFPAGLVYALLPSRAGAWGDRLGRGRVMAGGLLLSALVVALLPFYPALFWVTVMYVLFAVGWSMAGPAEDGLLAELAPPDLRGRIFGYREFYAGLGATAGPLVGGWIYDQGAAAMAFGANALVLVISALLAWRWFATSAPPADTGHR